MKNPKDFFPINIIQNVLCYISDIMNCNRGLDVDYLKRRSDEYKWKVYEN